MVAVSQLRVSLLPILQDWKDQLTTEFPGVTTNIYDWSVGSLTDWDGHEIGIECLLKAAPLDLPDILALSVSLKHVHNEPLLVSADLVWGHPSCSIEASVLSECIDFSPERLAELVKRLPELFFALKQAIQRGRPVS